VRDLKICCDDLLRCVCVLFVVVVVVVVIVVVVIVVVNVVVVVVVVVVSDESLRCDDDILKTCWFASVMSCLTTLT